MLPVWLILSFLVWLIGSIVVAWYLWGDFGMGHTNTTLGQILELVLCASIWPIWAFALATFLVIFYISRISFIKRIVVFKAKTHD